MSGAELGPVAGSLPGSGSRPASGSLQVSGLHAGYGRVGVVEDVTIRVDRAEMVALVGRNGAGKTTSLLAIAGLRYGPGGGKVYVGDVDISNATAHAIVGAGLALVPEGHRVFKEMTVRDSLTMGAYSRRRAPRAEIAADLDRVYDIFPLLGLSKLKQVGSLSGGQQQMVAVGQALMSRPRFLLLDEPMSGLAPALVDELYERLRQLVADGIGMLVVDQSIERALDRSDRFSVMENGKVVLTGTSEPAARDAATAIVLGTQ